MAGHNIIVMGASAGGVEALMSVVKDLPVDFPAAIFITLHVAPFGNSVLPAVLSRAGWMPAVHPKDFEPIQLGRIYVAPPDYHLLVKRGYIRLTRGAKENGHRPAVDPLFRTAASAYGPQVIGIILSGTRDDGTLGLADIKAAGGIAIVQEPDDAAYGGMPRSAIEKVNVDHTLPVKGIPLLLQQLVHDPIAQEEWSPVPDEDADVAELEGEEMAAYHHSGVPSGYICPDCGGSLWETEESGMLHFRCRVGHAWSPDGLLEEQAESIEEALWMALRALEEQASLARRIVKNARQRSNNLIASRFDRRIADLEHRAGVIRRLLKQGITGESRRKDGDPPVDLPGLGTELPGLREEED